MNFALQKHETLCFCISISTSKSSVYYGKIYDNVRKKISIVLPQLSYLVVRKWNFSSGQTWFTNEFLSLIFQAITIKQTVGKLLRKITKIVLFVAENTSYPSVILIWYHVYSSISLFLVSSCQWYVRVDLNWPIYQS